MAYSWSEEVVPAGTTLIPVDIEYLDKSYIYLYVNEVLVDSSDYIWSSDELIQLKEPVAAQSTVLIVRRTDKEYLYIAFAEGAAFIKENLDTQNKQFLHLAQELTEGRSIDGFFGSISMNGYRIRNLGDGIDPGDAVNKKQLDAVDARVTGIEQSINTDSVTVPWWTVTDAPTTVFSPPYTFTRATVYVGGICQTPGYSYTIGNNQVTMAEPVPEGTMVLLRIGQDSSFEDVPSLYQFEQLEDYVYNMDLGEL